MGVFAVLRDEVSQDELELVFHALLDDKKLAHACQPLVLCVSNVLVQCSFSEGADNVVIFDARTDEAPLIASCLTFMRKKQFESEILTDKNADWACLPQSVNDPLHLNRLEHLLNQGLPRQAAATGSFVRRHLQERRSPFSAALADAFQSIILLAECLDISRTPFFEAPPELLSRRRLDVDLQEFAQRSKQTIMAMLQRRGDLNQALSRALRFAKTGERLSAACFVRGRSPSYAIFVWLAIHFLRQAQTRCGVGDTAEAMALSVRALEAYCTSFSAELRLILFEDGKFVSAHTEKPLKGVGEIWSLTKGRLDPGLLEKHKDEVVMADEAIELRNRCIYGHGVQRLKQDVTQNTVSAIKKLLEAVERDGLDRGRRWDELWRDSEPVPTSALRDLVKNVAASRCRFGVNVFNAGPS